jgi:Zn-finger domain-containing protein
MFRVEVVERKGGDIISFQRLGALEDGGIIHLEKEYERKSCYLNMKRSIKVLSLARVRR